MNKLLRTAPEVARALNEDRPIVAFETTILSFGLPQPANRNVAALCEQAARDAGCTPATLAILEGRIAVGMSPEEIDFFCTQSPEIAKVNLQNFGAVLAARKPGALTVAASVRACALANLPVFATGGIGGVHRGFAQTPDISSDLRALGEYPVVVVSAGAKSILDVAATLELLEALGVPVVGYRTDRFPLFFSAESPYQLDIVCHSPQEVATLARSHFDSDGRGFLVVTPVPDSSSIPLSRLEQWIDTALREAADQHITGKALTPFLLARLSELSGGQTLAANQALIQNNARVAAQIASALAKT